MVHHYTPAHACDPQGGEVRIPPSLFRHAPWLGLNGALMVLACSIASIVILCVSDGLPLEAWRIKVTVVLAALSTVLAAASALALSSGVAVTWWRVVSHGTPLAPLHYIWNRGGWRSWRVFQSSKFSAFQARKIVLASLVLAAGNLSLGPLLQKATSMTEKKDFNFRRSISLDIAKPVPDSDFGQYDKGPLNIVMNYPFLRVTQQWWSNSPLEHTSTFGETCKGICQGVVNGTGIIASCTNSTTYLNLYKPVNATLFAIEFGVPKRGSFRELVLKTLYSLSVDDACNATIITETCRIQAAYVDYHLVYDSKSRTLSLDLPSYPRDGMIYHSPGDSANIKGQEIGPLTALASFGNQYFGVKTPLRNDPEAGYFYSTFPSNTLIDTQFQSYSDRVISYSCVLEWRRPTADILIAMQNILFRAGMYAGRGVFHQNTGVTDTVTKSVYSTDSRFLAGSIAVIGVMLAAVVIPLWGWWELECYPSLSPLVTARVFDRSIFAEVEHGVDVDELVEKIGHLPLEKREVAEVKRSLLMKGDIAEGVNDEERGVVQMREIPI